MKIFLDTNVVIDALIPRSNTPFVEKIFHSLHGVDFHFYFSSQTVSDIVYVLGKVKTQSEIQKSILTLLKENCDIISITSNDTYSVLKGDFPDFKDALQILCAEEKGCDVIITANKKHFEGQTEIPVFTPEEFLYECR